MQQALSIKDNTFIHFLIDPHYRIYRHLLAVLMIGIISFNSAYLAFLSHITGNLPYILMLGSVQLLLFLVLVYSNVYIFIPRFLLKEKYVEYIVSGSILILIIVMSGRYAEYAMLTYNNIPLGEYSYFNEHRIAWLDILAEFFIDAICFAGMTITALLREWIYYGEKKGELEKDSLRSEVERLKYKVSPSFLYNILSSAAGTVADNPQKTSDILMRLSTFLRYQLYDSSRHQVMLNSEIRFLENYLSLGNLEYDIYTKGNINGIAVPPLLIYALVNYFLIDRNEPVCTGKLNIFFEYDTQILSITCSQASRFGFMDTSYLNGLRKRLELEYPGNYRLEPDICNDTALIRVYLPNKKATA